MKTSEQIEQEWHELCEKRDVAYYMAAIMGLMLILDQSEGQIHRECVKEKLERILLGCPGYHPGIKRQILEKIK